MKLSASQKELLTTLAQGHTIKSHRFLDGRKLFRLHGPGGPLHELAPDLVTSLYDSGLLATNMKFPAATFFLSDAGATAAAALLDESA